MRLEKEVGALIDLKPVLNLNNELMLATRKASIIHDSYLEIEDVLESGVEKVDLRWNMVMPASVKIIDKETILLFQKGKSILVKFKCNIPIKLVIRPSEDPNQYKCEFGDYNYSDYNQKNPGTIMIGFDAKMPANKKAIFKVVFEDNK